jgi:hypothetical protein
MYSSATQHQVQGHSRQRADHRRIAAAAQAHREKRDGSHGHTANADAIATEGKEPTPTHAKAMCSARSDSAQSAAAHAAAQRCVCGATHTPNGAHRTRRQTWQWTRCTGFRGAPWPAVPAAQRQRRRSDAKPRHTAAHTPPLFVATDCRENDRFSSEVRLWEPVARYCVRTRVYAAISRIQSAINCCVSAAPSSSPVIYGPLTGSLSVARRRCSSPRHSGGLQRVDANPHHKTTFLQLMERLQSPLCGFCRRDRAEQGRVRWARLFSRPKTWVDGKQWRRATFRRSGSSWRTVCSTPSFRRYRVCACRACLGAVLRVGIVRW